MRCCACRVENNGTDLELNLDTLRETKCDPRAGAVMLQEIMRLQTVVLYSDFCGPKDMLQVHRKINESGRPDPSAQEKATTKKPSHSTTDMYHFMTGLRRNMSKQTTQIKTLQLIKVRPTMGSKKPDPAAGDSAAGTSLLTKKGPKDAWEQFFTGVALCQTL